MAKTYRYRRYLILISSLFILILCTDNSFTKVYAAPTAEQMLTAAKNLNLWLNSVKTCYKNRKCNSTNVKHRFADLINHFYFLESCMIEINERAKSCFISPRHYRYSPGRRSSLGSCIDDELRETQAAIKKIAWDLPENLKDQGEDVSSQIKSFDVGSVENLKIDEAYIEIFEIEARINELEAKIPESEAKIPELKAKIKELGKEKEKVKGKDKKKIGRKIKKKEEEIRLLERPRKLLKSEKERLPGANQKKNKICQELNIFSSHFSIILPEMRNAYLLMLEIECCIITEYYKF